MMNTSTDQDGHQEPAVDDFSQGGAMSVPSRNAPRWSLAKKDRAPRGVRRLPDGTWAVRYTCGLRSASGLRHLHQERVGNVKRDAIRVYHARRARAMAEPGWCPVIERRQERARAGAAEARRVIMRDYIEKTYSKWRETNRAKSGWKTDRGRLKVLVERFRDQHLDAITPLEVEQFRDFLIATGRARSTANRYRDLVSAIYTLAIRDKLVATNPVRAVTKFPEHNARTVYLTDDQEQAIAGALPETFRPYFIIAINTGLRWSEQMRLRWSDVDLLTGFITVRKTKNHQGRTVPANSIARAEFIDLGSRRHHPDDPDEWVFDPRPTQADFFGKAVERAIATLKDAGKDATMVLGFTWHGCRHSWASNLTMAGVDPRTLQVLGGWKTLAMVQRYAHLAPNHLQAAVERLVPSRGQAAGGGTGVSQKYDSPHVAALNGSESASLSAQEVPKR